MPKKVASKAEWFQILIQYCRTSDRLKASNDIPLPLAESITGHGRNVSDFAVYGSVGYTLEQKAQIISKILL